MPDRTSPTVRYLAHDGSGGEIPFDRDSAERLLADGDFFWLDLAQPTRATFRSSAMSYFFKRRGWF